MANEFECRRGPLATNLFVFENANGDMRVTSQW